MELKDKRNILKIIDEAGLFSKIENMTLMEFRKSLEGKGYCNLFDLVTISLLVFGFITGKNMVMFRDTNEDIKTLEAKFMMKYGLTKDETITLKMMAEGITNVQIADRIGTISKEGVEKRIRQIFDKLRVNNKVKASVMAAKEGLI